jgi:hypothetical protein
MRGRRLALAAAIAACCAAMALAAVGGVPAPVPQAGNLPARTAPTPDRPWPLITAPQLAALSSAKPLADPAPAISSSPSSGSARACGGLPRFSASTANEIMAGRLTIVPFPAATIDPNRDGDLNWAMNPFGNPTWGQDFRSGRWIEDLVAAYLAGGPQAGAYQARAKLLAAGWLQALPPSGRDPQTLVCIAQAFPGQSWINDQIPPTVNYYACRTSSCSASAAATRRARSAVPRCAGGRPPSPS